MSAMKILLTGGSGYVGSIVLEMLSGTYKFTSIDYRKAEKTIDGVRYFKKDITKEIDLDGRHFDGIVHLAGVSRVKDGEKDARKCFDVNVIGTVNVLDFAFKNNIPWVVIGGTVEASSNVYGLSKKMANDVAAHYSEKNINILVLQFSSIYGGSNDNKDKLIPILIKNAVLNRNIEISNGAIKIDFINLLDVARGIGSSIEYLAKCNKNKYQEIPLCFGSSTKLAELAELVVGTFDSASRVVIHSNEEVNNLKCDNILFDQLIGGFKRTTLRDGLLNEKKAIINNSKNG